MRLIAAYLTTASILAGCCNTDKRAFSGLSTTPADSRVGTVVALGRSCPTLEPDKEIAAIAAPLVAAGVSFAASYIAKAIERSIDEYKKGLSSSFVATGVAGHGMPIKNIGCIIIARGLLGALATAKGDSTDRLSSIYPKLGFRDLPAFYLELKAVHNSTARSIMLQPSYLSYAASNARNAGSGRKYVTLALALSQMTPAKADELSEDKSFAVFRMDLGRLEIGKRYEEKLLAGTASSVGFSQQSYENEAYNITALITETENPGVAFQVLSETFATKKGDLEKALEETIKKAVEGTQKTE